jgi:ATP-dependent exoDNAse (exonuclease V) beta subunit
MEGYVDLAYLPQGVEKDEGWVLVDYKTDQDASEKTRAAYQEQVRAYARMFASTGVGVGAAYLLFTTSGELWPIEVE